MSGSALSLEVLSPLFLGMQCYHNAIITIQLQAWVTRSEDGQYLYRQSSQQGEGSSSARGVIIKVHMMSRHGHLKSCDNTSACLKLCISHVPIMVESVFNQPAFVFKNV